MPDRSDALKRNLKKYLEAGSALSASVAKMSRADLERALREITRPGSDTREKVEDGFEEVRARSQRGAEKLLDLVRSEVHRDFEKVVGRHREDLSELAERATRLIGVVLGGAGEAPTTRPSKRASAKKAPAAKTPGAVKKTTAAKKSTGPARTTGGATKSTSGRGTTRTPMKATAAKKAAATKRAATPKKAGPSARKAPAKKTAT